MNGGSACRGKAAIRVNRAAKGVTAGRDEARPDRVRWLRDWQCRLQWQLVWLRKSCAGKYHCASFGRARSGAAVKCRQARTEAHLVPLQGALIGIECAPIKVESIRVSIVFRSTCHSAVTDHNEYEYLMGTRSTAPLVKVHIQWAA